MLTESNLRKLPKHNRRITLDLRNVLAGKILWLKCKKLLSNKFIDSLGVSNGCIRLRVENKDRPCVITHISDLEVLFPGNDILRDEE